MVWLGFDDTDSARGGCTTFTALMILDAVRDVVDLVGAPHLVRLNPNVPYKTRGNAAVCVRLGDGIGKPADVGALPNGSPLLAYPGAEEPSAAAVSRAFEAACDVIGRHARLTEGASPGIAMAGERPPVARYWTAVRRLVESAEASEWLEDGILFERGWNGGRGLLGAVAAMAWRGDHDATWEAIAYRAPEAVGSPRRVDDARVAALDRQDPSRFDSWDDVNGRARAVPSTPCPVLAGVRAEDQAAAASGVASLGPERAAGWLLFRTNQATDDHVRDDAGSDWEPYSSWRISADVVSEPSTREGGHVFVPLTSLDGRPFVAAAYEPTKAFRRPVARLRPGDRVLATGSFAASCETLALEKLAVLEAPAEFRRVKPRCDACGGAMRSKGQDAGFRCRRCSTRASADAAWYATTPRDELVGAYEVPVCARRHLAKPLCRLVPTPDGERAPLDAVAT